MKVTLFMSLGIMFVLFVISVIMPSVPVWAGGLIGIIIFLIAGCCSVKVLGQ